MSRGKALMVQGTGSYVGKTLFAAALCRILARGGYRVAPFKAQNMSLNSWATADGREVARAQALQAFAAGVEPRAEMNPILLKPKGGAESEVVLLGRHHSDMRFQDYQRFARGEGLATVRRSISSLLSEFQAVVIEGAGSPAEPNLYDREIVNMRVARLAHAPVVLVGDIERGGVFASIVGTMELLRPRDRERVVGFVINKFRGEMPILEPALRKLERRTGKPILGVVPYVEGLELPWEDSQSLPELRSTGVAGGRRGVDVAVVGLPHISNFTDLEPLRAAGASVRIAASAEEVGDPDVLVIPGTKNTVSDLLWLDREGFRGPIATLRRRGTPIVGICGGYQIIGRKITDPLGIEGGRPGEYEGIGLLDVATTFRRAEKSTRRVSAEAVGRGPLVARLAGKRIVGYEIHMGETEMVKGGKGHPLFRVSDPTGGGTARPEGFESEDGLVLGSYLHGIFDDGQLAGALLDYAGPRGRGGGGGRKAGDDVPIERAWERSLDRFCDVVASAVNLDKLFAEAGLKPKVDNSGEKGWWPR